MAADPSTNAFDPTVGPHSPAADDVGLSANDVTSPGVVDGREDIQAQERREQVSPPAGRGSPPGHPEEDAAAAERSDRTDVD